MALWTIKWSRDVIHHVTPKMMWGSTGQLS